MNCYILKCLFFVRESYNGNFNLVSFLFLFLEFEKGVVIVEEVGCIEDRVVVVLECFLKYDFVSCWNDELVILF